MLLEITQPFTNVNPSRHLSDSGIMGIRGELQAEERWKSPLPFPGSHKHARFVEVQLQKETLRENKCIEMINKQKSNFICYLHGLDGFMLRSIKALFFYHYEILQMCNPEEKHQLKIFCFRKLLESVVR